MKKLILSMFLCLFLVGLVSAGTVYNDDETFNVTKTDNGKNGTTDIYGYLDFNPNFKFQIERISDEVYEITLIRTNETKETNSSGGVSFLNKKNVSKDFVIVGNEDQTSYEVEDPIIEKPSKPDGSACLTEWVCENGDWIKADWMHPKRVESCITNYNEKNCAVAEKYWNKIIPGKYCVVLNDNGIGLKEKPTESCVKETIQVEQQTSEDKQEQPVIVPEKKKGFWNWFKGLFN